MAVNDMSGWIIKKKRFAVTKGYNTRNVSFQFLYGVQFTLSTQLIKSGQRFVFHFPTDAAPQFFLETNSLSWQKTNLISSL